MKPTTKKKAAKKHTKVAVPPYQMYDLVQATNCDGYTGQAIVVTVDSEGMPVIIQRKSGGWHIDSRITETNYKPHADFGNYWDVRGSTGFELIKRGGKIITSAKAAPELTMKFALKYDLDRDPVELFATKKEVRDRIADLVANNRSLKKESIWVYKLSSPKHIKVSTAISTF